MLSEIFSDKFPFVYNYFSKMLELVKNNERKFPQSLIFEGSDTKEQYLFALELARILNCQKDGSFDCDCINCKWIKSHSHPCVNNISQIHFKPQGDETKTLISVKQAKEIENSLLLSSDYYRFFIFFSSGESACDEEGFVDYKKLNYDTNINFKIESLEHKTFHPAALNSLLKSIEEPPSKTCFVFLTKSKENILSTIVSRSQTFKLNGRKESLNYNGIFDIISKYDSINYENAFDFSDAFINYLKNSSDSIELLLNGFMEYLKDLLKQNIANNQIYYKIKNDINIINEAIKYSRASVSDKTVLDAMFLKIARGY